MSPPARVRAQEACQHIQCLLDAGMSLSAIARAAEVSTSTIVYLRDGKTRTLLADAAARVLSVRPVASTHDPWVDGTGTTRRLRALIVAGWPQRHLARQLGWEPTHLTARAHKHPGRPVEQHIAQAVAELYDRIRHLPPPAPQPKGSGRHRQAQQRARHAGWAPPRAWEGVDIDDPATRPLHDHQLGAGTCGGTVSTQSLIVPP